MVLPAQSAGLHGVLPAVALVLQSSTMVSVLLVVNMLYSRGPAARVQPSERELWSACWSAFHPDCLLCLLCTLVACSACCAESLMELGTAPLLAWPCAVDAYAASMVPVIWTPQGVAQTGHSLVLFVQAALQSVYSVDLQHHSCAAVLHTKSLWQLLTQ